MHDVASQLATNVENNTLALLLSQIPALRFWTPDSNARCSAILVIVICISSFVLREDL